MCAVLVPHVRLLLPQQLCFSQVVGAWVLFALSVLLFLFHVVNSSLDDCFHGSPLAHFLIDSRNESTCRVESLLDMLPVDLHQLLEGALCQSLVSVVHLPSWEVDSKRRFLKAGAGEQVQDLWSYLSLMDLLLISLGLGIQLLLSLKRLVRSQRWPLWSEQRTIRIESWCVGCRLCGKCALAHGWAEISGRHALGW